MFVGYYEMVVIWVNEELTIVAWAAGYEDFLPFAGRVDAVDWDFVCMCMIDVLMLWN